MSDTVANVFKASSKLHSCFTVDQVETVFRSFSIFDPSEKKEILLDCMGVEEMFSVGGDALTPEEDYQYELDTFIEGSWRLLS